MKLGVLTRANDPFSIAIYQDRLLSELSSMGAEVVAVPHLGPVPDDCELLWDPGLGMRRVPTLLRKCKVPVVVTMHGLRAFSLPGNEIAHTWRERLQLLTTKLQVIRGWRWLRHRAKAVITVSRFGAEELVRVFQIEASALHSIYHGVAHEVFNPEGEAEPVAGPYFLVVSQYQPKKNLDRVLEAYASLPEPRPALIAIAPGLASSSECPPGVTIIKDALSSEALARWYRGALAYVCPSLHESFGMPLLEAMSWGCPVITSNVTACPEVTGEAAILVDPRSVTEIAEAMLKLAEDQTLRGKLRERGIAQASRFSWHKSAKQHLAVFQSAMQEES